MKRWVRQVPQPRFRAVGGKAGGRGRGSTRETGCTAGGILLGTKSDAQDAAAAAEPGFQAATMEGESVTQRASGSKMKLHVRHEIEQSPTVDFTCMLDIERKNPRSMYESRKLYLPKNCAHPACCSCL